MNIKKTEAAIEAILFTMGESVEAEKIAAAIDQPKTLPNLAGLLQLRKAMMPATRQTTLQSTYPKLKPTIKKMLAEATAIASSWVMPE